MSRPKSAAVVAALLATLALTALFVVVLLAAPSVQAAPAGNCTYYNNANHSTVVGQFGKDCCNNPVAWGVKTRYSTCGGCFICFPPNP